MAKTGLLVVTNPSRVTRAFPFVQKHLLSQLYIQYIPDRFSRIFSPPSAPSCHPVPTPVPAVYSRSIIGMYSQTLGWNLDVTILLSCLKDPLQSVIHTKKTIDVVFFDQLLSRDEVDKFLKTCLPNVCAECNVISLPGAEDLSSNPSSPSVEAGKSEKLYENVVLGGTFDRLHAGHKILLSEAVLRCSVQLTVGVTDESMLKNKYLSELIEPCDKRIFHVLEFLQDIDPGLKYNVVPISDPFGPTKEDPDLQMIVVSDETLNGGLKVNEIRTQRALPPLDIHSVNLLVTSSKQEQEEEDKVSSGNLRLRVLGTRLNRPEPRPNLPFNPYLIGLTGGIASGKSSVSRRLAELGAGVVDCDSLAHTLYRRGEILQRELVETFGHSILDTEGEVDRKVLGSIVFSDKAKLSTLNNLLWPVLLERTKKEIASLHAAGHSVVVAEAAVLRLANWEPHFHELWVCVIPPEEAVRRLKERNNMSEEAARARVNAQPNNAQQIAGATTVLSTLWTYDFTQRQVSRAWRYLHQYLDQEGFCRSNKL